MQLQENTTKDNLQEDMDRYIGALKFKAASLQANNPVIQWLSRNRDLQETFVKMCILEKIRIITFAKYIALLDVPPEQFMSFFDCAINEAENAKVLADNVEYFKAIRQEESIPIQKKCIELGINYKKTMCIKIFLQEMCDGKYGTISYPDKKYTNPLNSANLLRYYIPVFGADKVLEVLAKRLVEPKFKREQCLRILDLANTIFYSPNSIECVKKTFGNEFSIKDYELAQYLIDNLEYFKKLKDFKQISKSNCMVRCFRIRRKAGAEMYSLKV